MVYVDYVKLIAALAMLVCCAVNVFMAKKNYDSSLQLGRRTNLARGLLFRRYEPGRFFWFLAGASLAISCGIVFILDLYWGLTQ